MKPQLRGDNFERIAVSKHVKREPSGVGRVERVWGLKRGLHGLKELKLIFRGRRGPLIVPEYFEQHEAPAGPRVALRPFVVHLDGKVEDELEPLKVVRIDAAAVYVVERFKDDRLVLGLAEHCQDNALVVRLGGREHQ